MNNTMTFLCNDTDTFGGYCRGYPLAAWVIHSSAKWIGRFGRPFFLLNHLDTQHEHPQIFSFSSGIDNLGRRGGGQEETQFPQSTSISTLTRDMAPFELEIYDVGVLWAYAITLAPVILPALLSICGKGKASAWVALLLGTALVFMHALAGWYHGIYDGASYLAFSATVAILLPAFFATRSSWRLIRSA